MKTVPYVGNPGNACALACYTMVSKYLFPNQDISFEKVGMIAGWRPGYVVWTYRTWKWLMDQGVQIIDYDTIDAERWAAEGTTGLKASVSPEDFAYYKENTYDLDEESRYIAEVFAHPNFTYIRRKPTWDDVLAEYAKPGICDITLNSKLLNNQAGVTIHRVVILDITDTEVVIHDPTGDNKGNGRHVPIDHFRASFETLADPEIARYSKPA